MGGSHQRKCSACSFCGLFKVRKPRRTGDDASDDDDGMSARKTLPFDDDKGPFVSVKADPLVDVKADAFIAKFHAAARIAESEREAPQQAAGKAGPFDSVKPDPLVDSKADAFIAKFHAALIAESEREAPQQAAGKAG
ncbi:hypothetical protein OIU84_018172 [Salix udensis]|uniref:Uncharacterized protein n=1 Tax=Salix udensis TaxID=889485 RepID=A0AAD6PLU1_9ROSI|nr:hypothetical protein OIU84_018172 [Salix udensis]